MSIHLLKFFHLVFALGLLSLIGHSFFHTIKTRTLQLNFARVLFIGGFALATGSALVIPKQYTFHTPWIIAAYWLSLFFVITLFLLYLLKHKYPHHWVRIASLTFLGAVLLTILLIVVHDAVTKSTFLF